MSERYYKCGCNGVLIVTATPGTCTKCGVPFVECDLELSVDLDGGIESSGYVPLGPPNPPAE